MSHSFPSLRSSDPNRRTNYKRNLMEQHHRQNDQADLSRSEQLARYGNPARQTLFLSAKDQNRFVLGGKSSKPGAQCRKHQDDDEQQYDWKSTRLNSSH